LEQAAVLVVVVLCVVVLAASVSPLRRSLYDVISLEVDIGAPITAFSSLAMGGLRNAHCARTAS